MGDESCCTSPAVTGGAFYRTYTTLPDAGSTGLADPATVSGLRVDKYLVTVGRFRQFVTAWNGGVGYTPAAGTGKHSHLNGGMGLVNVAGTGAAYELGWVTSDDGNIAPTDSNLMCATGGDFNTWTPAVSSQENLPINCANWWEAYAFCIWDGGFLPSEAEWEYVAAGGGGGSGQREYPWGAAAPGQTNQYAIYGCNYDEAGDAGCTGVMNIAPVGTPTLGAGLWGQLDLVGDVAEWNLDWYATYVDPCTDCAYLAPTGYRVDRSTAFFLSSNLHAADRNNYLPSGRGEGTGFRCARAP
jgi:formylglycine-generating enzyme required for sulfatase activity